jgi:hypothetical protein
MLINGGNYLKPSLMIDREEIYVKIYQAATKTLKDLSEGIEHLTPQSTDSYRIQLSALYGMMSDEVASLEKKKAVMWIELKLKNEDGVDRPKPLSDKVTDIMYDSTKEGQRRIDLKYRLKSVEKMVSALAGHLRRLTEEAKNSF